MPWGTRGAVTSSLGSTARWPSVRQKRWKDRTATTARATEAADQRAFASPFRAAFRWST